MKKFIVGLGLLFTSALANAQGLNGSYVRLTPTTLPTVCRLGDVRVNSVSGALSLCNGTSWDALASGSNVPALTTLGDMLYEDATPKAVRLPGNTTTTKKFLNQTGNGTISAAPAWSALVGADLPNPSASTLGGVQSYAAVSNQWINTISTSGVPSSAQPAFSNISGTVAAAQLPNPSASTLGGIQSTVGASNQWISSISTSGVPGLTQPAFSNISGTASLTSQVTGVLPIANGGTNNGSLGVVAGSMYYADGTKLLSMGAGSSGQVPISSGSAVAWGTAQGGLIGDRELIPNTNLEVNATGYAAYANAAGVQPVDGAGGSPNTTCARTTSSPITGIGSLLITKSGSANRQGEGCAISTNTLSGADTQPNVETVEFDYKVGSGTFTAGNDTPGNLVDSDYEVYLYDIANSTIVTSLWPKKLYSNVGGHFFGNFQTVTNATTYRLILHNATTTTNNFTLLADNISIHPAKLGTGGSGPVIAKMNTLSTTSFTANAAITFTTIETDTYGALSGLNKFTCPLPGSYLVTAFTDTAASSTGAFYVAKNGSFSDTAANKFMVSSTTQGGSGAVIIQCGAGDFLQIASNASFTSANTKTNIGFYYLGGSTSGSSIPAPVVASRAHVSSAASTTALNPINYDTVDFDTTSSITVGATTWNYKCLYPGLYHVEAYGFFGTQGNLLTVYKNGAIDSTPAVAAVANTSGGGGGTTVKCNSGDTLDIRPTSTGTPTTIGTSPVTLANSNYVIIFMLPSGGSSSLPYFAPTYQTFTSGTSQTYNLPQSPRRPLYIRVQMAGGGGGGAASGSGVSAAGNGGDTTFGSSLLTAGGGQGGQVASTIPEHGGTGGTVTLNSPATGKKYVGTQGAGGFGVQAGADRIPGGKGGDSPIFGGGGNGAGYLDVGNAGTANTGGGGQGAGNVAGLSVTAGSGGGSGGVIDAVISNPSLTYTYTVGAAGSAGSGGSQTGGAGATGIIIVEEYYQ